MVSIINGRIANSGTERIAGNVLLTIEKRMARAIGNAGEWQLAARLTVCHNQVTHGRYFRWEFVTTALVLSEPYESMPHGLAAISRGTCSD